MTKRACVIGYPVSHSRSPLVHGFWLREYGIDGRYDRAEVPPHELAEFIAALESRGYVGANVTVPHKEAVFRLARVEDPVAQALGAVNTLWLEGGRMHGMNTDVAGFLANLDESRPGWDRSLAKAVVLGAGGAARAVIYGLLQRGAAKIVVVNRTLERARELRVRFKERVAITDWNDETALVQACLLVNTTSLGMTGQPALFVDLSPLPADALVTDLVYTPLETPLLAAAKARGLTTADGLGMLLHQAVPGFERWFGVRPKVTKALRDHVLSDLSTVPR